MKILRFNFLDLLKRSKKLTFLVGAGCSVESPSNLGTANDMMKAIIEFSCLKSEIQKILNINGLRFEELVELYRDLLDPNLKILDYYGECNEPNLQHIFLAQMIKKGNFVITTNFDSLIEYALLKLKIPKESVIPVITEEDFEKFSNPYKLNEESKYPVYKIHGSVKNIITSQNVKASLISTLQALGSNKKGTNILSVEYYKKPLLEKITEHRSLVVIGYSGGDDFDIIPTIKTLKKLENIYWINHTDKEYGVEQIYKIEQTDVELSNRLDAIDIILVNIKKASPLTNIYKININTSILIKKFFDFKYKLKSEPFSITPTQWLNEKISTPNTILKCGFTNKIYYRFNRFNESLRCSERMLEKSIENDEKFYKAEAYNNIGKSYMSLYNFIESMINYKKAVKIYIKLKYLEGIINVYNSFGWIYYVKGNYKKSIYFYKKSLKFINSIVNSKLLKSIVLNNLAGAYNSQGYLEEAFKLYEESLLLTEDIGNMIGMASIIDNMGSIFHQKGDIGKAIEYYNKAKDIFKIIFDIKGEIASKNKIGKIYYDQGNLKLAKLIWKNNLKSAKKINDFPSIANGYNNLGSLFVREGNKDKAMNYFKQSLKISEKLERTENVSNLTNIALVYAQNEEFDTALKIIEKTFQILKDSNNAREISSCLSKKGQIYDLKKDYQTAVKYYEASLKIAQKRGYKEIETNCLHQIGVILARWIKFDDAISSLMKALEIAQKNELVYAIASINKNLGIIFFDTKKYQTSYSYFNSAFNVYQKLNNIEDQIESLKIMIKISIIQENFKKTLNNYNILIELLCKSQNINDIGKIFIEKAKIFFKLEKLNLALLYFKKILKFNKEIKNDIKADVYNNLGYLSLRVNKDNRAIIYLEKAVKFYRELNIINNLETSLNTLGSIYLKRQEFTKAYENINESLNINIKNNNHLGVASNYKLLGDFYFLKGKKKKAKNYYRNSLNILKMYGPNDSNIVHRITILYKLIKKCEH